MKFRIRYSLKILFTLLILSPLAFGTVQPWSMALMEIFAVGALWIYLCRASEKSIPIYEIPGLIPLLLLAVWMVIQLIPIPGTVLRVIAPSTAQVFAETLWLVDPDAWGSFSLHPENTLMRLMLFVSYVCIYVLTIQLLVNKDSLRLTVRVVSYTAAFIAIVSIIHSAGNDPSVLWLIIAPKGSTPFGPFVSKNLYAGYIGMILPLMLGLFLARKPRLMEGSILLKLREVLTNKRTGTHFLIGFFALVVATSLLLSLSRGGIISSGISVIVMSVMLSFRHRNRGIPILVLLVLIVLFVGWFGWEPIIDRFDFNQALVKEVRPVIWNDSIRMIQDFFLFGVGFGVYGDAYPAYRTLPWNLLVDHAHNDYLEVLAEGGFVGLALAAWFVIAVFARVLRAYNARRETYAIYITAGALAGAVSILVHGFSNFNLYIGSNGLYFFFCMALAVSASHTRYRPELKTTKLNKLSIPQMRFFAQVLGVLLIFYVVLQGGALLASGTYNSVRKVPLEASVPDEVIDKASFRINVARYLAPFNGLYRYAGGNIEGYLKGNDQTWNSYIKALRRNPLDARYLTKLGQMVTDRGDVRKAELLYRAGVKYGQRRYDKYISYALWLEQQGRREDSIFYIREAISAAPKELRRYVIIMERNGYSQDEILRAMPKRVHSYLSLARHFVKNNLMLSAEEAYLGALDAMKVEPVIDHTMVMPILVFYQRSGRNEEALGIMHKAIELLPSDAYLRVRYGRLYERLEIPYRAVEEYEKALIIDPMNKEAKEFLYALRSKVK
ncbi:O-antigen ligase family protein [Nitrospirota bacterium]